MPKKTFSFSLDTIQDADLIERIAGLEWGRLSGVVRAALRGYWQGSTATGDGVTLAAIARLLDDKLSKVSMSASAQQPHTGDIEGTQDAANNLDSFDFG